jgi:hypothetical protein
MTRGAALVLLLLSFLAPSSEARHRAVRHPPPPTIEHVFVLIMENQNADRALREPFVERLAAEGALLSQYHCITHPSQPNYIALAAGSTWGVRDDKVATLDVAHLGDLLDARGLSWKLYAERYPGNCFLGSSADNDLYVRRHVPFLEFTDMQKNKARCTAHVVNANELDADLATDGLPSFAMYVPDQQHNGHDSDSDTADAWMESKFGPLLKDPRFTSRTLFVLTYDESETSTSTHISTVFWGAGVQRGATSSRYYDHYDLLRTIEALLHLPTLNQEDFKHGEVIADVLNVQQ